MPFPDMPRIIYAKNPLKSVICQVRFPRILMIDTEPPAKFQEAIRGEFPVLADNTEWILEGGQFPVMASTPPSIFGSIPTPTALKNYSFSTENSEWVVNLTGSFLALSTTNYERWESFRNRLEPILDALVREYRPPYFSRIGLRYIDVIKRSTLGLKDVQWNDLLQAHILGVISDPSVGTSIEHAESRFKIRLEDELGMAMLVTKLAEDEELSVEKEQVFVIDSDFAFEKRLPTTQTLSRLDEFHQKASKLIQWCILPRLSQAMIPTTID